MNPYPIARHRCIIPGCDGWMRSELHGEFRIGPVHYRQYMNCRCSTCHAEEREIIRSRTEGQTEVEVYGLNFLLYDAKFERFWEIPGFGQSMRPLLWAARGLQKEPEELIAGMIQSWLERARQEYESLVDAAQVSESQMGFLVLADSARPNDPTSAPAMPCGFG